MKFFVTAAGDNDVGLPSRTSVVTIDNLPEDAMFWDNDTREEARSTLAAAFAILLGVPCYVAFESDSSEELLSYEEREAEESLRTEEPDDDWPEDEGKAYGDRPR